MSELFVKTFSAAELEEDGEETKQDDWTEDEQ